MAQLFADDLSLLLDRALVLHPQLLLLFAQFNDQVGMLARPDADLLHELIENGLTRLQLQLVLLSHANFVLQHSFEHALLLDFVLVLKRLGFEVQQGWFFHIFIRQFRQQSALALQPPVDLLQRLLATRFLPVELVVTVEHLVDERNFCID